MFKETLKELEIMSKEVGKFTDYVQGGGGNTSVKLNDELMAVKASGYQLKQITTTDGFVVVNYKDIKDYYENVDLNSDIDYDKDSVDFAIKSVVELEGIKTLRPSVEAGFHSILKKYVIHSHSVYGNIVGCSYEGEELVKKIFAGKDYECIWIPYINPGFTLTLKIKEEAKKCEERTGKFPEVIFMENHGPIVNADDLNRALDIHTEINDLIKEYFSIEGEYPAVDIDKVDDETFISKTEYTIDFIKNNAVDFAFFDRYLSPDQLVYIFGNISIDGEDKGLNIDTKTGITKYKATEAKARTMEEVIASFIFIVDNVNKKGLTLKVMNDEETSFIKNWEVEKYRQGMVK